MWAIRWDCFPKTCVNRSTSCSILAACPNHSLVKEVRGRGHPPNAFRSGETRHPTETSTRVNPHAHQIWRVQGRKRATQPLRPASWPAEKRVGLIRKRFFAILRPFSRYTLLPLAWFALEQGTLTDSGFDSESTVIHRLSTATGVDGPGNDRIPPVPRATTRACTLTTP